MCVYIYIHTHARTDACAIDKNRRGRNYTRIDTESARETRTKTETAIISSFVSTTSRILFRDIGRVFCDIDDSSGDNLLKLSQ